MSALLTDPTVVLAVTDDDRRPALGEAVLDGVATALETRESVASVRDRLSDADRVGCAVVTDGVAGLDVVTACEAVADVRPKLPVVAAPVDGSESLAGEATRAGADWYVPGTEFDGRLRTVVDDALERYARRREDAEESQILTTLLEDVGSSVYAKDHRGRHVRAASVPGGYSPDRLRGQTDLDVFGDEAPDVARQTYQDDMWVIEEREPIYDKLEHHQYGGQEHWFRTTKVPWLDDDGDPKGLVGLSWDVTDYVHQEQRLAEQDERMDRFASYVSHDLQGPLQVATGSLALAADGEDEALDRVGTALDRMEEMLEDLSALAKRGRSTTTFETEEGTTGSLADPTDLRDLVTDVWEVARTEAATLSVEFRSGTVANEPETSLRPVFENLFTNAVSHVGTDVTVRVGPLEDGDGFYVEDDGPGIPPAERDRVVESGYTTARDGTGMGLSIVAETVDRRGWDLRVTDGAEGGARFEVRNCLLVERSSVGLDPGDRVELTGHVDVGDTEIPGDARYDEADDAWTVAGAGSNVWRQDNEFHYVYVPVEGPARIQGRVVEMDERSDYSKAGVMVRDDLEEGASYGYAGLTPGYGAELLWRTERGTDGVSRHLRDRSTAYPWYRIERVGDTVTASLSPEGGEWYAVDQRRVTLGETVYLGLVVCSFTPMRLCEATFEDVTVSRLDRP